MHKSIKEPITMIYISKYLRFPLIPGTACHILTLWDLGFATYFITEFHICHSPTIRNRLPGRTCPLKDPVSFPLIPKILF